ncbi:hypothetical protein ACFX2H_013303 [Malus domestica]
MDAVAHLISIVEPAMNEGEKDTTMKPVQKMPVEKKLKASSAARESLLTTERLVIDLTSSKRKKDEKFHRASNVEVYAKTFVMS